MLSNPTQPPDPRDTSGGYVPADKGVRSLFRSGKGS